MACLGGGIRPISIVIVQILPSAVTFINRLARRRLRLSTLAGVAQESDDLGERLLHHFHSLDDAGGRQRRCVVAVGPRRQRRRRRRRLCQPFEVAHQFRRERLVADRSRGRRPSSAAAAAGCESSRSRFAVGGRRRRLGRGVRDGCRCCCYGRRGVDDDDRRRMHVADPQDAQHLDRLDAVHSRHRVQAPASYLSVILACIQQCRCGKTI